MFCTHCGKQINDEAVVCPGCGVPTNNTGFDKATTSYQPNQGYQQPVNNSIPNRYAQNYQPVPQPKVTNICGIIGFVFAILSLWLGAYFCLTCIVGLVLSIIGMVNLKKCNSCNGLAIAGLVISIVTLVFWGIIWLCLSSAFWALIGGGYYY